jgi:sec-independent protein translocase protein TatA
MAGLTPMHLILILGIAVLVLGPKRLPEAGEALGRALREFREAVGGEEAKAVATAAPAAPVATAAAPVAPVAPAPAQPIAAAPIADPASIAATAPIDVPPAQ